MPSMRIVTILILLYSSVGPFAAAQGESSFSEPVVGYPVSVIESTKIWNDDPSSVFGQLFNYGIGDLEIGTILTIAELKEVPTVLGNQYWVRIVPFGTDSMEIGCITTDCWTLYGVKGLNPSTSQYNLLIDYAYAFAPDLDNQSVQERF